MTTDELKIETVTQTEEQDPQVNPALLEAMLKAGVLFGRRKAKTHPRMQKYIFTTRSGMEILDIVQTIGLVDRANEFLARIVKEKGSILFVGTTPAAKSAIRNLATKFNFPFVTERWLGGTLTNWKTINERLQYFLKLRSDRAAGRLEKYTKKERLGFDKEIERLTTLMGGIEVMKDLPQVVVVVGATVHETAVREAKRLKIPIVGIISTDANPADISYPIPANDRSKSSVEWVLGRIEEALSAAVKEISTVAVK